MRGRGAARHSHPQRSLVTSALKGHQGQPPVVNDVSLRTQLLPTLLLCFQLMKDTPRERTQPHVAPALFIGFLSECKTPDRLNHKHEITGEEAVNVVAYVSAKLQALYSFAGSALP